jgi:multicomponent Na+:H+ antiporter subunit C
VSFIADHYNYWVAILIMMIGLYPVIAKPNLVKKVIGLSIFQTGIFLFFITIGKVESGTAPVVYGPVGQFKPEVHELYTNSIPTALILTGIVVSVATMAAALAIVVNIRRAYGTIEQDEIDEAEHRDPE